MIFNIHLKNPNSIALKDDSGLTLTYGELANQIIESNQLLQKRSVVIVLASNDISTTSFILSCLENKWIPLVLNEDIDESLLNEYLKMYKPNAIFLDINKCSSFNFDYYNKTSWLNKQIYFVEKQIYQTYDQLSFLLPTSGSTGSPKLVRHSYDNLNFSALNVSALFNLNTYDIGLAILPIYYTMGFSVISSHIFAGSTVVLSKYALTERGFWDVLKNEKITTLTGVPYTFEVLFKMRFERVKIPSLRIISQGGGKLSDQLWDKLILYSQENNIEFIPTYGQTEGTARMSYLKNEFTKSKKGSIGKAIPNGVFEVWDENDNVIESINAVGQLVYKGGNVTLGYAENSNDLIKGDSRLGVLPTGDIVKRDSDGFYFIVGRSKRFLKIFGLRISLDEVELLIKNNFDIDCYCTGSDDLLTVYVDKENFELKVKNWLSQKINLFHQVIEVKYIPLIPRNASGKVIFKE
jgi:acyl-coenzyme A synthetase/AMP-(fatty) acid ligase